MDTAFIPVCTAQAGLSNIDMSDGQLIWCYDSGRVFLDINGTRYQQGIQTVQTVQQLPQTPAHKLYYVRDVQKLFYFTDRWIDVTTNFGFNDVKNGYTATTANIVSNNRSAAIVLASDADMDMFALGDTIWLNLQQSQSGELVWVKRQIESIMSGSRQLSTDPIDLTAAGYDAANGKYVVNVSTNQLPDWRSALSFGGNNFVVGESAVAAGSWNAVHGAGSVAAGTHNTVAGSDAYVFGQSNLVQGDSGFAAGSDNRVQGTDVIVLGDNNVVQADNAVVLGSQNSDTTGTASITAGHQNKNKGQQAVILGSNLQNNAPQAVLVGTNGVLASDSQYTGAFVVGGGFDPQNKALSLVHKTKSRVYTLQQNSVVQQLVPDYTTRYRGTLNPFVNQIDLAGSGNTIQLQPHKWSRYKLTASGPVTVNIEAFSQQIQDGNGIVYVNYGFQQGDVCQLVFDTTYVTPVFPQNWVAIDFDISEERLYMVQVIRLGMLNEQPSYCYKVVWPSAGGVTREQLSDALSQYLPLRGGTVTGRTTLDLTDYSDAYSKNGLLTKGLSMQMQTPGGRTTWLRKDPSNGSLYILHSKLSDSQVWSAQWYDLRTKYKRTASDSDFMVIGGTGIGLGAPGSGPSAIQIGKQGTHVYLPRQLSIGAASLDADNGGMTIATTANAIELGTSTATDTYIDFHTAGSPADYGVRSILTGAGKSFIQVLSRSSDSVYSGVTRQQLRQTYAAGIYRLLLERSGQGCHVKKRQADLLYYEIPTLQDIFGHPAGYNTSSGPQMPGNYYHWSTTASDPGTAGYTINNGFRMYFGRSGFKIMLDIYQSCTWFSSATSRVFNFPQAYITTGPFVYVYDNDQNTIAPYTIAAGVESSKCIINRRATIASCTLRILTIGRVATKLATKLG